MRRRKPRRQRSAGPRAQRRRRCASWRRSRSAPTPSSRSPTRRSPPPRRTKPRRGPRTSSKRPRPRSRTWGTQLDTAKADAKSKLDDAAAAKDAAKAAETRKADAAKAASEAKLALEPVSVYISPRDAEALRSAQHAQAVAETGEVFDATIEVPVTIRNPEKPIGTHVLTARRATIGLRWTAVTIDNGDDAGGRARAHHHPAGCARSHRADRIAAILDHHLDGSR